MEDIPENKDYEDETVPMSAQQRRFSVGGISRFETYKELIAADSSFAFFLGFELYNLLLSNPPSLFGAGLRSLLLPCFLKSMGKGCVIGRGVTIRQPSRISLGRSVLIDDYAVLDVRSPGAGEAAAADAGISIGDNVLIGRSSIVSTKGGRINLRTACNISSSCRIATRSTLDIGESVLVAAYAYIGCGNHRFEGTDRPIIEQEMEVCRGVKIGANSWIGARATILDGVTIGENAVIGAHSLVRDDVPANAIAAGTPAKVIRYRD